MTEFHISEMTPTNEAWVSYNRRAILGRCRQANDPIRCVEIGLATARARSTPKTEQKRLEQASDVLAYEQALAEITTENERVLASLRENVESTDGEWCEVYLDKARQNGMTPRSFAGHLSALAKAGLYRPHDNFAWGLVRMANA